MNQAAKIILVLFLLFNTLFLDKTALFAQNVASPSSLLSDSKVKELQEQIKQYEQKISELQGQKKTLFSQIKIMESQIKLTELRIGETKGKIKEIEEDIKVTKEKITRLESNIEVSTKALLGRISAVYQFGRVEPWQIFFSSDNISSFFDRLKYLRIVQAYDKRSIYTAEQAKVNYTSEKELLEIKQKEELALKKRLEDYTGQIEQERTSKENLLIVTKNDEEKYQSLLDEARRQISAFKSFTFSKTGGSVSILPQQASPDGWFYNQRDERWARATIGSSNEQVWDVGCLVAAVAMILKKKGQDVTPIDIARNASYFFSDTAYMLLPWAGGKFSSLWGFNQSDIDSRLSDGEPVIVGVRAGVYGMHFVVLKSGSNGAYVMNDPWNGADLKFSDYYSTSQIFQYGFYK